MLQSRSYVKPRPIDAMPADVVVHLQLILNNFSATNNTNDARQLSLMQTMFQNLFPPIKVHTMPLSAARRVVLLSYNPVTRTIDFRHYLISIRPVGVSRSVRKIIDGTGGRRRTARETSVYSAAPSDQSGSTTASFAALRAKGLPDLRNAQDISDYILNHGEMGFLSSASEAESDASGGEEDPVTGENGKQIELAHAYVGRANKRLGSSGEKRAVRLTELGPRIEFGLVKIEDGIGDGKGEVLFHEFIHKTPKEAAAIARKAKEKERLAKSRRAEQEANVKRKKEEKEALKKERADKKKAKIAAGEAIDEDEERAEGESDSGDEFEYEDMFAEGAADGPAAPSDVENDEDDDEVFDEASEDEDEEQGDDDSDLSPIPYNESSEGESASEDEAPAARPAAKQARPNSSGASASRGKSSGRPGRGKPGAGVRGRGRSAGRQ